MWNDIKNLLWKCKTLLYIAGGFFLAFTSAGYFAIAFLVHIFDLGVAEQNFQAIAFILFGYIGLCNLRNLAE